MTAIFASNVYGQGADCANQHERSKPGHLPNAPQSFGHSPPPLSDIAPRPGTTTMICAPLVRKTTIRVHSPDTFKPCYVTFVRRDSISHIYYSLPWTTFEKL